MIHRFELMPAAVAADLIRELETMETVDGRLTAGIDGQHHKRNQQVPDTEASLRLAGVVGSHLARNQPIVEMGSFKTSIPFRFSKHGPESYYGPHTDNAYMQFGDHELRADLSMTVFLSDPASYDGGELVIGVDTTPVTIKLPAGAAVLYSGDTLHQVNPVTRGVRWAAVGWFQSRLRLAEYRALHRDLLMAENMLRSLGSLNPDSQLRLPYERVGAARRHFLRLFGE